MSSTLTCSDGKLLWPDGIKQGGRVELEQMETVLILRLNNQPGLPGFEG